MPDLAVEQRSAEWHAQRCGKITASEFGAAVDITQPEPGTVYKSGPRKGLPKLPQSSAARDKYMRELAFERRSGTPVHEIGSRSMTWGREVETFAREAVELETGLLVKPAAFQTHPLYPFIGASADGWTSDGGGLEMKSPHDEAVHLQTILEGMPEGHRAQVQGGMWVTGRPHWWFASYDPRQAEADRLYVERIQRDDDYIEWLSRGLLQFEAELKVLMAHLDRRNALRAAA